MKMQTHLPTLAMFIVAVLATAGTYVNGASHIMDTRSPNVTSWAIHLPLVDDGSDPYAKLQEIAAAHGCRVVGPIANLKDYFLLEHDPDTTNRAKRSIHPMDVESSLQDHPDIAWAEEQRDRTHYKRLLPTIEDPLYSSQWHLHNSAGWDLNVIPAWERGLSGRAVAISIVDDGVEWRHGDFGAHRYLAEGSHDWNSRDDDPSPTAHDDTHGTSCAGLAYAGMNNGKCGVGLSYNALVSGQRLISGSTTDAMEASGLTFRTDINHIYSASWGPMDDGMRLEGPGRILSAALKEAITNGRGGKGSIFVWAGGNGGTKDNVNYDGYANSIYTIAIASVDSNGRKAYYSEEGSPIVVSSVSSSPGIVTTAVAGVCTNRFGGTSASAPMIAGGIGLMLEANPNLTWRDVIDILVRTARKNDEGDSEWVNNGAGFHVNHKYGFGLADIGAACAMAADTSRALLPPFLVPLRTTFKPDQSITIPDNDHHGIISNVQVDAHIIVEQVGIEVKITHPRRGELVIAIRSPAGTISTLQLPHGDRHADINWTYTSMRHWGEESAGNWGLAIADPATGGVGMLNEWTLVLYGHAAA